MRTIIRSNAKINLGLDVINKREDGYHNLDMIMAPIDLFDFMEVEIFDEEGTVEMTSNIPGIPTDSSNIIVKCSNAFYRESKLPEKKMKIDLQKNVPFSAGLGGGSSNGAEILKFLNSFYGNFFSEEKLIEISKKIGADIPFFIKNSCARVRGIGEIIEPVKNGIKEKLILIKPKFGINTGYAYGAIYKAGEIKRADIEIIKKYVESGNVKELEKNIENSIWYALRNIDENIMEFERRILAEIGLRFFMSGSGSCYYAFVDSEEANATFENLKKKYSDCFISLNSFL